MWAGGSGRRHLDHAAERSEWGSLRTGRGPGRVIGRWGDVTAFGLPSARALRRARGERQGSRMRMRARKNLPQAVTCYGTRRALAALLRLEKEGAVLGISGLGRPLTGACWDKFRAAAGRPDAVSGGKRRRAAAVLVQRCASLGTAKEDSGQPDGGTVGWRRSEREPRSAEIGGEKRRHKPTQTQAPCAAEWKPPAPANNDGGRLDRPRKRRCAPVWPGGCDPHRRAPVCSSGLPSRQAAPSPSAADNAPPPRPYAGQLLVQRISRVRSGGRPHVRPTAPTPSSAQLPAKGNRRSCEIRHPRRPHMSPRPERWNISPGPEHPKA